jgi:hypothetical protein
VAVKKYQALLDEFELEGGARTFAKRFLKIAQEHPSDPKATDALLWVVTNVRGRGDTTTALQLLEKQHVGSEKLSAACANIVRSRSIAAEPLLRGILKQGHDLETRAEACFHLARLLETESGVIVQLAQQPDLAPRVLQYYGKDYGKHLSGLTLADLDKRRELVYQQMLKSFSKVKTADGTMGELAQKALFAIHHLTVGKQPPEIKGEDIYGSEFKLSDYRGKVVMLTFWGHW